MKEKRYENCKISAKFDSEEGFSIEAVSESERSIIIFNYQELQNLKHVIKEYLKAASRNKHYKSFEFEL